MTRAAGARGMSEPWVELLAAGRAEAAWDALLSRYRRLVFASIRHFTRDHDDTMEIFAATCEALRADDFHRLRTWAARAEHRARFSTWLVTVVHHLTIDWIRHRDGRPHVPVAIAQLPPLHRRLHRHVFVEGRSHAEALELALVAHPGTAPHELQSALREVYRAVTGSRRAARLPGTAARPREEGVDATSVPAEPAPDPAEAVERTAHLERALATLSPQDRVVVELYVIEQLPAADVARIAGLPDAKTVYNRVYRALAALRERLAARGLGVEDL